MRILAKLSLCMLVNDQANGLGRALASVSKVVDEMILVDLAVAEETVAVAREWGARVYPLKGAGRLKALQLALQKASGDCILILWPSEELVASREQVQKLISAWDIDGYFIESMDWSATDGYHRLVHPLEMRLFRKGKSTALQSSLLAKEGMVDQTKPRLAVSNLTTISAERPCQNLLSWGRGCPEVEGLFQDGLAAYQHHRWLESIKKISAVLKILKQHNQLEVYVPAYRCYYLLGLSNVQLKRYQAALHSFALASRLQPLFVETMSAAMELLLRGGSPTVELLERCFTYAPPDLQVSISRRWQLEGRTDVALYGSMGAIYQMAGGQRGQRYNCRTIWPHACEVFLDCLAKTLQQSRQIPTRIGQELYDVGKMVVSLPEEVLVSKPAILDRWRKEWVVKVLTQLGQRSV